jgi:replicative DNA helicase
MGKTALATNIAYNIAKAYIGERQPDGAIKRMDGGIVGFFSLEMSSEQLATRIIAEQSGVASYKIRRGEISEPDFARVADAAREMERIPFYIDQTGGISIAQLVARARRLKRQKGLDVLVIDYLQLLRSTSRRGQENRQIEISEISAGIKGLAKELNIPIVVAAQLNRNPENRTGDSKGRPRLSDLRESGSIEQDADLVGLLVRQEYYADTEEEKDEMEGKAELIIAKQRNGPTGDVPLTFRKEFTRFEDRAREEREPM